MHVSEIGLPENESPFLLEHCLDKKTSIDKLKWSQILLNLKRLIINFPIDHLEVIGFSHKSLDKVQNKLDFFYNLSFFSNIF